MIADRWFRRGARALVVLAAALAGASGPAVAQGSGFTKGVEDRATYYRLTVELAYKGEPVTLDVVVGCNARITHYRDSDRSVGTGIAPMVYGLKMRDGAGVIVRPPEACNGETTENGRVPANLLPLVMVVEDADKPWFAVGYGREEAYDSPLSVLRFGRATISRASRAEFEEWRRTQAPRNLVKPEMLAVDPMQPFGKKRWYPGRRYFPDNCRRVVRLALPEPVREAIRPFRPAGEPRYWFGDEAWKAVRALARPHYGQSTGELFAGRLLVEYFGRRAILEGLPRAGGGGAWGQAKAAGEIYPDRIGWSLNAIGLDGKLELEPRYAPAVVMGEAVVRPETCGFMDCHTVTPNEAGIPVRIERTTPGVVLVNGEIVANDKEAGPRLKVAGRAVYDEYEYFEDDTHVFMMHSYGILSLFGAI